MNEKLPGEVYALRPGVAEPTDPKQRPHLLLSRVTHGVAHGTVAYCSTEPTEAEFYISHEVFDPRATTYKGAGFSERTYIYVGRLRPVPAHKITQFQGRVIDEMPRIRSKLVEALGLGKGTARGSGIAAGSNRGRIAIFSEATADRYLTYYGIVVTHPGYSRQRRYLTVVPIFLNVPRPRPGDLIVEDEDWLAALDAPRALVAAEEIFSPFWGTEPARQEIVDLHPTAVVDDETMAAIEKRLVDYFELHDA